MTIDSQIMTLQEIGDLTRRALSACGASGQQLELAVQSVVDAECDGIRTVGLNYLPLYCGHLQVGKLKGDAVPMHTPPEVLAAVGELVAEEGAYPLDL